MTRTVLLALLVAAGTAHHARAEDDLRRKDRATFNTLSRQIRTARNRLAAAQDNALTHARSHDGEVPDPLKAEIVSLQDEIDRKKNRIELIALRHGWDIPDFDAEPARATPSPTASRAEIFGAADRMIRDALRGEAHDIAAGLRLPVISFSM